jgi:hypothetical protein
MQAQRQVHFNVYKVQILSINVVVFEGRYQTGAFVVGFLRVAG